MSKITKSMRMEIVGKAILFAALQASIASAEMSSRYSVNNFSVNQQILQSAADALSMYLIIAGFWALGTTLLLGASYGLEGILWSILFNAMFMGWIGGSYWHTFKQVAARQGLEMPHLFGNFS
jgi:hypothetical protein